MLELWKDIESLRKLLSNYIHAETIYIDFLDVLALRKFISSHSFNNRVYEIAQKQGVLRSSIGYSNYSRYRELMNDSSFHLGNLVADKAVLLEIEYNVDKKNLYINPYIYSFINHCKQNDIHICVVNNTLYSNGQLYELLELLDKKSNGIPIIRLEDTNEKNGIYLTKQKTQSLTMKQIEYNLSAKDEIDLEQLYHEETDNQFYYLRKAIAQSDLSRNDIYFRIGSLILGPLMSLFTEVVYNDLKKKNINLLLPLMREGDLIHDLFLNRIKQESNASIYSKPLYVSRKSTFIPALSKKINAKGLISFFETRSISISDLCKMFNVPIYKEEIATLSIYRLKEQNYSEYNKFISYFESLLINEKLEQFVHSKKGLIQRYIKQIINEETRIATIDIGFNGTIQENLEQITDNIQYHHYLLFGREGILSKLKQGINISSYINNQDWLFVKDIVRGVDVFEQLIVGIEGSTLDYEGNENRVDPLCEQIEYPINEIKARKQVKNGILYFQKMFFSIKIDDLDIERNLSTLGKSLHRLINKPLKEEVMAIGQLHYSTNFGSYDFQPIINFNEIPNINNENLYKALKGSSLSSNISWPQGILTLKDATYSMKDVKYSYIIDIYSKISNSIKRLLNGHVSIYGAGEVAKQVYETLNVLNVKPICYIDKNEKLHGNLIEGIEVISPNRLLEKKVDTIVIASYTFGAEIENDLKELYGNRINNITIIRIDN